MFHCYNPPTSPSSRMSTQSLTSLITTRSNYSPVLTVGDYSPLRAQKIKRRKLFRYRSMHLPRRECDRGKEGMYKGFLIRSVSVDVSFFRTYFGGMHILREHRPVEIGSPQKELPDSSTNLLAEESAAQQDNVDMSPSPEICPCQSQSKTELTGDRKKCWRKKKINGKGKTGMVNADDSLDLRCHCKKKNLRRLLCCVTNIEE